MEFPSPDVGESEVLSELMGWLTWIGLDDPTQQVYSPVNRPDIAPHSIEF